MNSPASPAGSVGVRPITCHGNDTHHVLGMRVLRTRVVMHEHELAAEQDRHDSENDAGCCARKGLLLKVGPACDAGIETPGHCNLTRSSRRWHGAYEQIPGTFQSDCRQRAAAGIRNQSRWKPGRMARPVDRPGGGTSGSQETQATIPAGAEAVTTNLSA